MPFTDEPAEGCRHERVPLKRLGKICHERTGENVYVLLCTECGFTVTTEQLRRRRDEESQAEEPPRRRPPKWAPSVNWRVPR
jgi:hypothetical protein